MYRDITMKEISEQHIGQTLQVAGWVENIRDHGGVSFIDLRDMYGTLQVVMRDTTLLDGISKEMCISIEGLVEKRDEDTYNPKLPTGTIELEAKKVTVLGKVYQQLPFEIMTSKETREDVRLKYRYLDLRNKKVKDNMIFRSQVISFLRQKMTEMGFLEMQTPILCASSPEGARDYLVPSRIHQGKFYALPQSPQLFKQLLMCSGCDRYFQLAKCFRDEDLRADRQPEFTQIDMELSFVDVDDVIDVNERLLAKLFREVLGVEVTLPIPRMTWREAMDRYGSDKPDIRFGMELTDVTETVRTCEFAVFKGAIENGGSVRGINAKGQGGMPRKKIDKLVTFAKDYGAKGLAYIAIQEDGAVKSSFAKFMTEEQMQAIYKTMNAEQGDLLLIIADKTKLVLDTLGGLRCHIADTYNLYDKSQYDFLWVTDFPLLEYDEEAGRYCAVHHPFTSVKAEDIPLLDTDPGKARANAYDFVINGQEAGGGSIRIHNVKMQEKMFAMLGMTEEDIKNRFGFFVDAFKYGAPPHGGLAFGLDRLVMLVTGTDNIKDVIAFPKVQNASCLMSDAPSKVDDIQLKELFLEINNPQD